MKQSLSRRPRRDMPGYMAGLLVAALILNACGNMAVGAPPLPPQPTRTVMPVPTLPLPPTVTPLPATATAVPPPPPPPTPTSPPVPPPPVPPAPPTSTPVPPGTIINITGIIQQIFIQNNVTVVVVNNVSYVLPPNWIVILGKRLEVGVPIVFVGQYDTAGQIIIINVIKINNYIIVVHPPAKGKGGGEDDDDDDD